MVLSTGFLDLFFKTEKIGLFSNSGDTINLPKNIKYKYFKLSIKKKKTLWLALRNFSKILQQNLAEISYKKSLWLFK